MYLVHIFQDDQTRSPAPALLLSTTCYLLAAALFSGALSISSTTVSGLGTRKATLSDILLVHSVQHSR